LSLALTDAETDQVIVLPAVTVVPALGEAKSKVTVPAALTAYGVSKVITKATQVRFVMRSSKIEGRATGSRAQETLNDAGVCNLN